MKAALADTHALLWWLSGDDRLSGAARVVIERGEVRVHFSAASIWEIVIKAHAGKLVIRDDLVEALRLDRFLELPITARHASAVGALPLVHRDPFDRMIVAQAQCEAMTVITADRTIAMYGVPVLW